jgi:hypothetical protein
MTQPTEDTFLHADIEEACKGLAEGGIPIGSGSMKGDRPSFQEG